MIDQIFAATKGPTVEETFEFALQHQMGIELSSFYTVENLVNSQPLVQQYQAMFKNYTGSISIHGPIYDLNVVSLDPDIAEISERRYIQAINVAKALQAKYLVFHTQWTPIYPTAGISDFWTQTLVSFWRRIVETHLEGSNLTVVIENFMDQSPETLVALLSAVDSPHLKACLDIGHVNLFSNHTILEWVKQLNNQMAYIHAHNNWSKLDSHNGFDDGSMDLDAFLTHLIDMPHRVDLAIETNSIESLSISYALTQSYLQRQNKLVASKSFLI
ncbi:MAG: sugar phosphate isomerase/epimerase family protein [Cyanobacteria bacterium P01_H01_bin.74]